MHDFREADQTLKLNVLPRKKNNLKNVQISQ